MDENGDPPPQAWDKKEKSSLSSELFFYSSDAISKKESAAFLPKIADNTATPTNSKINKASPKQRGQALLKNSGDTLIDSTMVKDTADRINGLERPKPNEGYALKNGIFNNGISQSDETVNTQFCHLSVNPLPKDRATHRERFPLVVGHASSIGDILNVGERLYYRCDNFNRNSVLVERERVSCSRGVIGGHNASVLSR